MGFLTKFLKSLIREPDQKKVKIKKIRPLGKIRPRHLQKGGYYIGLEIWKRGLEQFLRANQRETKIERERDQNLPRVYYQLPDSVTISVGKEIRKHLNLLEEDAERAIQERYQAFVRGHAQYREEDHREGIQVHWQLNLYLPDTGFTAAVRRSPSDEEVAAKLRLIEPKDVLLETNEYPILKSQGNLFVGADVGENNFQIETLARDHFSINRIGKNFQVFHTGSEGKTEIQREGKIISLSSKGDRLIHGDRILAYYGGTTYVFEFTDLEVPSYRERRVAYLEERAFYIVTQDTYEYPRVFLGEIPSGSYQAGPFLRWFLPEFENENSPVVIFYEPTKKRFYLKTLSEKVPVKIGPEEIFVGKHLTHGDVLQIGTTELLFEEFQSEGVVRLEILSPLVEHPPYRLTKQVTKLRPITLSGSQSGPGFISLQDPKLPDVAAQIYYQEPYFWIEIGQRKPEKLAFGQEIQLGQSILRIMRTSLHPRWKARFTLINRDQRRIYPLANILQESYEENKCILGDGPSLTRNSFWLEDDMDVISEQHAQFKAKSRKLVEITNLSTSRPIWILSPGGIFLKELLWAKPDVHGNIILPGESMELRKNQRIVIGPYEFEYNGPGPSSLLGYDEAEAKLKDPWEN
ncbi:MAG TPA: hypothetical protein VNM22_10255 [Candidatus Limnocylindrales bacterium]|nr:hypothetical protein [Candidatus Limnocylindrales bacterium]